MAVCHAFNRESCILVCTPPPRAEDLPSQPACHVLTLVTAKPLRCAAMQSNLLHQIGMNASSQRRFRTEQYN